MCVRHTLYKSHFCKYLWTHILYNGRLFKMCVTGLLMDWYCTGILYDRTIPYHRYLRVQVLCLCVVWYLGRGFLRSSRCAKVHRRWFLFFANLFSHNLQYTHLKFLSAEFFPIKDSLHLLQSDIFFKSTDSKQIFIEEKLSICGNMFSICRFLFGKNCYISP